MYRETHRWIYLKQQDTDPLIWGHKRVIWAPDQNSSLLTIFFQNFGCLCDKIFPFEKFDPVTHIGEFFNSFLYSLYIPKPCKEFRSPEKSEIALP